MDNKDSRIHEIVEMLDEFTNSEGKRVKIDTSDKLKEGETKKSCFLSKYDRTDPSVYGLASIPDSKTPKIPTHEGSFKLDFFNIEKTTD